jgi:arginase
MKNMNLQSKINDIKRGDVAILGIPSDENSSFMAGPAEAPGHIRQALHSGSANLSTEDGTDLDNETRFIDIGDLVLSEGDVALQEIEAGVGQVLQVGAGLMSLGGDHSITYPILRAYAAQYQNLNILQFDAHSDTYEIYAGNRFSHACPFARIMEEGLANKLVQCGIRTLTKEHRAQNERFGIQVHEMRNWQPGTTIDIEGLIYISLDLDALDPAFAPGVSHHEPGGLSTRDILHVLQNLNGRIVGADIVELNPKRDINNMTAMTAAKLLKEIAALMLR